MAERNLLHLEFGRAQPKIKPDGTRVTPVDIAISQSIRDALARQFP